MFRIEKEDEDEERRVDGRPVEDVVEETYLENGGWRIICERI